MASTPHEFDAIIVGARVAGTAAAIMLARQGRRVLVVDKAAFPSDTISTHIVLAGGTRVLAKMGVLPMLEQLGGVRFDAMRATGPGFDYTSSLIQNGEDIRGLCLGRLKMDAAMIDAARGIESVMMRERFRVTDLIIEDGAIVGIRGEDSTGSHEFHAPLTIGADGFRSTIAQLGEERLGAFKRVDVPCRRAYYYAYYQGVDHQRLRDELLTEFESAPGEASLICRCEDGRAVAAVAFDTEEMRNFRTDLTGNFNAHLGKSLLVGKVLEGATIASKVLSAGFLLNTYRDPVVNGALLLGDSGLHVDPLFGQGHSLALMSADIMQTLAPEWFSASRGSAISADAMSTFTRERDAALMPYYNASVRVSRELALDKATLYAHRAANTAQWAADELIRFGQMASGRKIFPSFRFARVMGAQRRDA
ncbi:MAG TPA: FAD-dependent monooxygenase [Candidatus Binataceae bacterium]|nr:FAD-dependent monooxygenase [Candidatus Binataceae bacterium]